MSASGLVLAPDPDLPMTTAELLRASRLLDRICAEVGINVTTNGARLIMELVNYPKGLALGDLAGRLGCSHAALTLRADLLERDGVAERTRPFEDRRKINLALVPEKRAAVLRVIEQEGCEAVLKGVVS